MTYTKLISDSSHIRNAKVSIYASDEELGSHHIQTSYQKWTADGWHDCYSTAAFDTCSEAVQSGKEWVARLSGEPAAAPHVSPEPAELTFKDLCVDLAKLSY